MKTKTIITEISAGDLTDLFSAALCGSNYLSAGYDEQDTDDNDECFEDALARILLAGGAVQFADGYAEGCRYGSLESTLNEDGIAMYTIRLDDVMRGLERASDGTFNARPDVSASFADGNKRFARRSFNAFASDDSDWDATTADCLMQIILFDEIIYG